MIRISVRSMLAEVLLYTINVTTRKDFAGQGDVVSNRSTCPHRRQTVKVEARWIHTIRWDSIVSTVVSIWLHDRNEIEPEYSIVIY